MTSRLRRQRVQDCIRGLRAGRAGVSSRKERRPTPNVRPGLPGADARCALADEAKVDSRARVTGGAPGVSRSCASRAKRAWRRRVPRGPRSADRMTLRTRRGAPQDRSSFAASSNVCDRNATRRLPFARNSPRTVSRQATGPQPTRTSTYRLLSQICGTNSSSRRFTATPTTRSAPPAPGSASASASAESSAWAWGRGTGVAVAITVAVAVASATVRSASA